MTEAFQIKETDRAPLQTRVGPERRRPRIAICDHAVTSTSPIGSCLLVLLEQLCEEVDFTVFAAAFENPRPDRIRFVHVPVAMRPLVLLYTAYNVAVLPLFYWSKWIRGTRFDLVQCTENYALAGSLRYSQFCHKHYLQHHWRHSKPRGLKRVSRWIDHQFRALNEGLLYRRAQRVVVASFGLRRELCTAYRLSPDKFEVISNPVDLARFARPADFSGSGFRAQWNLTEDDVVATFVALGHFERKGLPHIFQALRQIEDDRLKLLIVGGREDLIAEYCARASALGILHRIRFVGMQSDVRPFFWCSDMFLFPSHYEVFSLVTLQAAAAGLPMLSTKINGIEEYLEEGVNGMFIECSADGVEYGLRRFLQFEAATRSAMGAAARASVERYSQEQFVAAWARVYAALLSPAVRHTRSTSHSTISF